MREVRQVERPVDLQISILQLQNLSLQQRASEALHPHEEELKKLSQERKSREEDSKVLKSNPPEGGRVEREGEGSGGQASLSFSRREKKEGDEEDPARDLGLGRVLDIRS